MNRITSDARHTPLASGCADIVVWSPPYFAMREYGDSDSEIGKPQNVNDYIEELVDAAVEGFRLLKPGMSQFINVADRYVNRSKVRPSAHQPSLHGFTDSSWAAMAAAGKVLTGTIAGVRERSLALVPQRLALALLDRGYYIKSEIIWHKTFGVPDPGATDRCFLRHEVVLHVSSSPQVFMRGEAQQDVWTIAPSNGRPGHPAPFPDELVRRILSSWCPEGGHVVDLFGGSGTTGEVAESLGMSATMVDIYDW